MSHVRTCKLYMLLQVLQIAILGASAQLPAQTPLSTRTLIRAGHILDVKTGAEPAAQTKGVRLL